MKAIKRSTDIITGEDDLELLYTFKNFPVFMGCVEQDAKKDLAHDMNIYISRGTGMIQLNPVLPLDVVYQTEHNPGATGPGWDAHHKALAKFMEPYNPRNVFEIGGAHGILSQYYTEFRPNVQWTILEPNPVPVDGLRAKMQKGFFTETTKVPEGVDMIVHSHVLEHVYDPRKFIENLSKLPAGTKMCFSVPALKAHLRNQFTNVLNFEHTYFCTEEFIEWLLGVYGFDLLDRQYYLDDHSIFYAVTRSVREPKIWSPPDCYQENSTLFETYIDYHERLIREINEQIASAQGDVYLFGAHAFSQFLITFGLDTSKIKCILDNNTHKQGKRLYGTDLTIESPKALEGLENPVVILRTGVFNDEIKRDIIGNINAKTIFLE